MKKTKKNSLNWMTILMVIFTSVCFVSCSVFDDNDTSIAGTWVSQDKKLILGRDGSYWSDYTDHNSGQFRKGTYSYNSEQKILVTNIIAIEGHNGAYTETLIVQTLNSTTLVLLYLDGSAYGFFTRE